VVTDELSASVEGTEYGVRRELPSGSNAPGNVSVFVREGHVLCAPGTRAKWSPVRLAENQSLAVSGYRAPAGARPIDARALTLGRRRRAAPAPIEVAGAATGPGSI
jgi:hypothetical protein